ncbi:MAG: hypothetical protein VW964_04810, partial [Ilumatobacter sp.]
MAPDLPRFSQIAVAMSQPRACAKHLLLLVIRRNEIDQCAHRFLTVDGDGEPNGKDDREKIAESIFAEPIEDLVCLPRRHRVAVLAQAGQRLPEQESVSAHLVGSLLECIDRSEKRIAPALFGVQKVDPQHPCRSRRMVQLQAGDLLARLIELAGSNACPDELELEVTAVWFRLAGFTPGRQFMFEVPRSKMGIR